MIENYQEFVEPFIPLDKSWAIRIGVQDLLYGNVENTISQLEENLPLCDDLIALNGILKSWDKSSTINVGESGTLFRFFKYINWKYNLNKDFVTDGTLSTRSIANDPNLINLSQMELLDFDNHTSQWASASVLCGDAERLQNPPFKLALTYESWDEWHQNNRSLKYDETIRKQAITFLDLLNGNSPDFKAEQAEDYPFAYVFDYITEVQGLKLWPSLKGHESNRIVETTVMKQDAISGKEIISKDHRIVQALGMWGLVNNVEVQFTHPDSVNKSWPRFWEFISGVELL